MEHLEVILVFPGETEVEKKGILHLDDDNKHWLEYTAYGYEHMDKQFPVIYATHDRSEDLYTCIQCTVRSMDVTFCILDITELIIDEHSPSAVDPYYLGLIAQINGLTNWLGRKAFNFSFSTFPEAFASTIPNETTSYELSDQAILSMQSWCMINEEPEKVSFFTSSQLGIFCENPATRMGLYNHALNFLRIQSLFLDRIATFSKIELIDHSQEKKELQRKDFRLQEGNRHHFF